MSSAIKPGTSAPVKDVESEDESRITRLIVHALRSNPCIPAERISVVVSQGVVTLEGQVNWNIQKMFAEAAAKSLGGVRRIANLIIVSEKHIAEPQTNRVGAVRLETENGDEWVETGAAEAG